MRTSTTGDTMGGDVRRWGMKYCVYIESSDVLFHDEKTLYSALFAAFRERKVVWRNLHLPYLVKLRHCIHSFSSVTGVAKMAGVACSGWHYCNEWISSTPCPRIQSS